MEIGESVGVGIGDVLSQDKPTCDHQEKKDKYNWKARVNGYGADSKKCSGANLFEEKPHGMWARKDEHEKSKGMGVVPKKRSDGLWARVGLGGVTEKDFPLQAHHLIPKNFLPKQSVCVWLCQKWDKDDLFQLEEDTEYNTDHANNGYAMPYATKLKEWKSAKNASDKTGVAFRVMDLTRVQLHQGSHAGELDPEKLRTILASGTMPPVVAASGSGDSDAFEDAEIHNDGYLNQIKEWLNAVAARIEDHVRFCTLGCKKDESGEKTVVRPLKDSVRLMNRVSYIAKVFLQMNLVYACPYGAAYAASRDLLVWTNGRYVVNKDTPQGTQELTVADVQKALSARSG